MSINQIPVYDYVKQTVNLFCGSQDTIVGNIRIEHKRQDEVIKLLKSLGGYLCVKEFTGCEHFHFAIEKPNVNRDTIAKKIRTAFPELKKQSIGGAKQYHVAHIKDDFQIYYLFKEWHKDTNPFTMTNSSLLIKKQLKYDNSDSNYYTPSELKVAFAEYCIEQYDDKKETFKKHTPGQFLEYLYKQDDTLRKKKTGVPDSDLDVGQKPEDGYAWTYWSSDEFRRQLCRDAIVYLKKIDIATCGPNKIWDLVNYAHLHVDEDEYAEHILYHSIR